MEIIKKNTAHDNTDLTLLITDKKDKIQLNLIHNWMKVIVLHANYLNEGLQKYHDELVRVQRLTVDCSSPYKKQEEVEQCLRLISALRPPTKAVTLILGSNYNICRRALENILSFERQSFDTWEEFKETRQQIETKWGSKRTISHILNQNGITADFKDIPRKTMLRALRKDDRFFLACLDHWIAFLGAHHPALKPFQFVNEKTYRITHDDNVFAISEGNECSWRFVCPNDNEFLTALLGDYLNISRCSRLNLTGDITRPLLNSFFDKGWYISENKSGDSITLTKKRKSGHEHDNTIKKLKVIENKNNNIQKIM